MWSLTNDVTAEHAKAAQKPGSTDRLDEVKKKKVEPNLPKLSKEEVNVTFEDNLIVEEPKLPENTLLNGLPITLHRKYAKPSSFNFENTFSSQLW